MMPGSRSRRAAGGAVVALALATLGGCQTVGIGRLAAVPNRPASTLGAVGRAALLPATVALDVPSEMSSIDPSNSASGTVTPASAIGSSSPRADLISTGGPAPRSAADPLPPTPLLDAALVRAKSRGEVPDTPDTLLTANLPRPTPITLPTAAVAPAPEPAPAPVIAPPEPPRPVEIPPPAPPVSPEEAWRDGVRKLVGLARSKQEQGAGTGTGTGVAPEPWGLRARVLAWLAEPDIDPDLGQHDADTVRAVLRALQAAATTDPHADARNRGDDVRLAVQTLEAKAPLELVDLQLCSKVERFGDFVPLNPPARRAGEWVVIYCEVDGLHQESTPDGYQTRLAGQFEIIPEGGGRSIVAPLEVAKETFPRRRRDYYMAYLKQVPQDLAPGAYTVRITLRDVFTDRSASRAIPLTIVRAEKDPAVAPAP